MHGIERNEGERELRLAIFFSFIPTYDFIRGGEKSFENKYLINKLLTAADEAIDIGQRSTLGQQRKLDGRFYSEK
jgi:hypothetical protein